MLKILLAPVLVGIMGIGPVTASVAGQTYIAGTAIVLAQNFVIYGKKKGPNYVIGGQKERAEAKRKAKAKQRANAKKRAEATVNNLTNTNSAWPQVTVSEGGVITYGGGYNPSDTLLGSVPNPPYYPKNTTQGQLDNSFNEWVENWQHQRGFENQKAEERNREYPYEVSTGTQYKYYLSDSIDQLESRLGAIPNY